MSKNCWQETPPTYTCFGVPLKRIKINLINLNMYQQLKVIKMNGWYLFMTVSLSLFLSFLILWGKGEKKFKRMPSNCLHLTLISLTQRWKRVLKRNSI